MVKEVSQGENRSHLESQNDRMRFIHAEIPLQDINVLDQPRKTFEDIENLAQSIAQNNLLHPLIVAKFSSGEANKYIQTVNQIWGKNHSLSEITASHDDTSSYYVLLAGERRFRACKHLNSIGCQECQEAFGEGPCYERHFGNQDVEVKVANGINSLEAIKLQATENTHKRVPPHEEARAYRNIFAIYKEIDPKVTLAKFSREMGRSPETIRTALRYCLLPDSIQTMVEDGFISYGIAGELSRLSNELSMDEQNLMWWAQNAVAKNTKVPEFRESVGSYIQQLQSGQGMLEIFTEEQEKQLKKTRFRKTAAAEMVQGMWMSIGYMRRVEKLVREGKIGKEDSPFSEKSPLRIFGALLDTQMSLLPHIHKLQREKEAELAEEITSQGKEILTKAHDTFEITESAGSLVFSGDKVSLGE